ncbi:NUDIX domain-containing protein [Candidatus Woesebacteria bacterium]|nr:NUDIX domain-containing protein [Candidatus Woesebacteria bacterium]
MAQTKHEYSAGGIVYKNQNGQRMWLLIQHIEGHWGFPKGHVGDTIKGENPKQAALREVKEETNIQAKIVDCPPFVSTYFFRHGGNLFRKQVTYFLMSYEQGEIDVDTNEILQGRFVPTEEVANVLTYKNDKKIFENVKEMLKSYQLHS